MSRQITDVLRSVELPEGTIADSSDGLTPICKTTAANRRVISLEDYQWRPRCCEPYQLPVAA